MGLYDEGKRSELAVLPRNKRSETERGFGLKGNTGMHGS